MLFRPLFALLTLLPTLAQAQPAGKGCDSLNVPLKGATAPITAHMSKVNARIKQICEKVPQLDSKIVKLGKDCAGTSETSPTNKNLSILGTAGMSGDSGTSVDGHVANFTNRTHELCQNIKNAANSITEDKDSFCSYYAGQTARAEAIMKAKDDASKTSDPNAQAQIFANLKKKLGEIAAEYKKVSSKAGEYVKSIERALPGTSDPKSARTDDQGLHQLLDFMSRDTAARLADIDKQSANLQKIFNAEDDAHKNTDRPSANALMAKLSASKQACTEVQSLMKGYVDVMENNLLPNGRNMTKLLDAAAKDSDAKSADSEKEAEKAGEKSGKLGVVKGGDSEGQQSDITGTGKKPASADSKVPAPADKPAAVADDASKEKTKPGQFVADPSLAYQKEAVKYGNGSFSPTGLLPGEDGPAFGAKPSDKPAPDNAAPVAESPSEQKQREIFAAAGLDKSDSDAWLQSAPKAPAAPAPLTATATGAADPYAPAGSPAALVKAESPLSAPGSNSSSTEEGNRVTKAVLDSYNADTAKQATVAAANAPAFVPSTASPVANPAAGTPWAGVLNQPAQSWSSPATDPKNLALYNAPSSGFPAVAPPPPTTSNTLPPSAYPSWVSQSAFPSANTLDWKPSSTSPPAFTLDQKPMTEFPAPVYTGSNSAQTSTTNPSDVVPPAAAAESHIHYGGWTSPELTTAPAGPAPASVDAPAVVKEYSQGGLTGSHADDMPIPQNSADKNAAIANASYWDRWPGTMTSWEGYSPTSKSFSNTANGSTTWYQEWCKGSTCYYRAK